MKGNKNKIYACLVTLITQHASFFFFKKDTIRVTLPRPTTHVEGFCRKWNLSLLSRIYLSQLLNGCMESSLPIIMCTVWRGCFLLSTYMFIWGLNWPVCQEKRERGYLVRVGRFFFNKRKLACVSLCVWMMAIANWTKKTPNQRKTKYAVEVRTW